MRKAIPPIKLSPTILKTVFKNFILNKISPHNLIIGKNYSFNLAIWDVNPLKVCDDKWKIVWNFTN